MPVGRNEPCPCGRGKKFKSCCINNASRGMSRGLMALLAGIAVIAAVGVIPSVLGEKSKSKDAAAPVAAGPNRPAPPGKVWSAEHGHWHDATPSAATGRTPTPPKVEVTRTPARTAPTPPGPAPAGKVWSAEHGHWHDAQR